MLLESYQNLLRIQEAKTLDQIKAILQTNGIEMLISHTQSLPVVERKIIIFITSKSRNTPEILDGEDIDGIDTYTFPLSEETIIPFIKKIFKSLNSKKTQEQTLYE